MRPADRKYLKSHEWCLMEGDIASLGISDHAVTQLGDLIHLELPEVGSQVTAGDTFGEIESVKSVADIYSPVSGEVIEINEALVDNLESLGNDAYNDGWMIKVRFTGHADDLMDAAAYDAQVESEDH
jgi:glycine cleavage system H protein